MTDILKEVHDIFLFGEAVGLVLLYTGFFILIPATLLFGRNKEE